MDYFKSLVGGTPSQVPVDTEDSGELRPLTSMDCANQLPKTLQTSPPRPLRLPLPQSQYLTPLPMRQRHQLPAHWDGP